jgi:DNA repair protein RecO (recombination protein O)
MHHLYHTKAFVLSSSPYREADKLLALFTQRLGLVRVIAPGLRYEKSKLRYALQDLSCAHVSLLRGKHDMWRLTTSTSITQFFTLKDVYVQSKIAQIFLLLEKMIAGEEPDGILFEIVEQGIQRLAEAEDKEKVDIIERLFLVKRVMKR